MKRFDIKKIITILAASAMTLSVTSCARSGGSAENTPSDGSSAAAPVSESAELTKIVIGTPGANGVAMESATIAQVEKFFDAELEKAGYAVEFQGFALAGPAVNEAFASGAVDFAVYGDQPAITAASNGIDVKIIASVNNYLEHALLISNNIEFDSLEDLKGKKIVVGFGTPVHRYVYGLLERAGLSADDVELINSPTDGPTLIASGDADIAASSQAAIRAFEAQGIGTYYETPLKQDELSQIFVLAGSQKSIDKYPGAAEALVKALDDAYKFAQENPDKAYEDLSQGSYPEAINRLIYATLAEILREYDYSTFAAGKWHLSENQNPSGPYDNWPLGKGFERYYGFISAETDQYHPFSLTRDNTFIPQPKEPKDGYHLSVDITDNAIDFIYNQKNSFPDKPFFLYLAYGAMHTPHHVPKEYIDRYKGKFDQGWDKVREEWFENQKRLGIIPQNAELTDRAPLVDPWDSLDSDHKKLYSRYMETFAGFLEHTDEQIGRVIDFLKSIDQFDNTVIVLLSDNGASAEGGIEGRFNAFSGQDITTRSGEAEFALEHIDEIGGEYSFNHYPTGWANALNTPFQWYKIWFHEGGIKDPLIISYPKLIGDKGGIRSQYHHVSDITPTVLDILGIEKPKFIKGVPQKPMTGTSLKYTFEADSSESRKHVQYYETFGNRAIYKDGWKAVVNHAFNETYEEDEWELYHTAEDYSEKYNVADKYPEKLRELREEFFLEAGRHNVFPMLRFPFHSAPEKIMRLYGDNIQIPETERTYKNVFKPYMLNTRVNSGASLWISAEIDRKDTSVEGILFSQGDRFGGFVFYIKDNRLKFVYNANRFEYFEAVSEELPSGKLTVRLDYDVSADEINVTLSVNGSESGKVTVTRRFYTPGMSTSLRAGFYTEVSPDYTGSFEFTGDINSITIHQYGTALKKQDVIEKIMNAD